MMMTEAIVTLEPTILLWIDEAEGAFAPLAAHKDGLEALVVFRTPEDALCYQQENGQHTLAEGFQRIGVGPKGLTALLGKHGLEFVALPEPWSGCGGVPVFDAGEFVRLLEESPVG
jgi:hypothetical protein